MEGILENTYGILVYQEQIMLLAQDWRDTLWLKQTLCGGHGKEDER
jgi:hypothetical protein